MGMCGECTHVWVHTRPCVHTCILMNAHMRVFTHTAVASQSHTLGPGVLPGLLGATLCACRFGVIHSVFTNLLLWANGVLNESKHQLNEHKGRLITLGFGNVTMGEQAGSLSLCQIKTPGGSVHTRMFQDAARGGRSRSQRPAGVP